MYLRHQAYAIYYPHVCILVFLHVFWFSMLLRCMLKFKCLACGIEDVTQYNIAIATFFLISVHFTQHPTIEKLRKFLHTHLIK